MSLKFEKSFEINGQLISESSPTYFIADIAANHDGDLGRAIELIYKAKEAGADAAKFQHFKANSIVSDFGFKNLNGQQSHQASWKKSVFDVYDDASLDVDWNQKLKEECDKAKIAFMTSPYSFDLVDAVDKYIPAYKIGSGDITWHQIIKYIAQKNKPFILATGASSLQEVIDAVDVALANNSKFALLQCNTNYTASLENFKYINLNVLKTYKLLYPDLLLGLSDHTPGHATVMGAVALGARIIEKHFTDDTKRIGPDHAFSMDPFTWKEMVDRTRELEYSLGSTIKQVEENEKQTVVLQRRSIRLKNDIAEGQTIGMDNIEFLRPCPVDSIQPYDVNKIIGLKTVRKMQKGEHLTWKDLI